jgi:hypothetical protein
MIRPPERPYEEIVGWRNRRRAGWPLTTAAQMYILLALHEAERDGWPWVYFDGIDIRVICKLLTRKWIIASPGDDGVRYRIGRRGIDAMETLHPPVHRVDGLCPRCGEREKYVSASGHLYPYCRECRAEVARGKARKPPQSPWCGHCGAQPRHVTRNGRVCHRCADCDRAMNRRTYDRQQRQRRQAIRRGDPPTCRLCNAAEVHYTERYVYDQCADCLHTQQRRLRFARAWERVVGS